MRASRHGGDGCGQIDWLIERMDVVWDDGWLGGRSRRQGREDDGRGDGRVVGGMERWGGRGDRTREMAGDRRRVGRLGRGTVGTKDGRSAWRTAGGENERE